MTTTSRQEVMTAEQANALKEYQRSLDSWHHEKRAKVSGVTLSVAIALALWALSFYASAYADGELARQLWLKLFTLGSFITAGVVTIIAITLAMASATSTKPTRPVAYERVRAE